VQSFFTVPNLFNTLVPFRISKGLKGKSQFLLPSFVADNPYFCIHLRDNKVHVKEKPYPLSVALDDSSPSDRMFASGGPTESRVYRG